MKTYFEEPEVRVEKFTAESVMSSEGLTEKYSFLLSFANVDVVNDRTQGIFARPF